MKNTPQIFLALFLLTPLITAAPPIPPQGFINCEFEGNPYIGGLFEGDCQYNANQSAGVTTNVTNCAVETHETTSALLVDCFVFHPETLGTNNPIKIGTDAFGYFHWNFPVTDKYVAGQNYTIEVDCAGIQNSTTRIVDVGGDSTTTKVLYNFGAYSWTHPQDALITVIFALSLLSVAAYTYSQVTKRRGRR